MFRSDLSAQKLIRVLLILVLIGFGFGGFSLYQNNQAQIKLQKLKTQNPSPQIVPKEESELLIEEIRKIVDLPLDETPQIATITDIEKLKAKPFFLKAKNGDKVLIYQNAKKIYLYDPEAKKIIDVAPIGVSSDSASQNPIPTPQTEAKIVLRNGTSSVGLTTKYEPTVTKIIPDSTIKKENASKKDFDRTIVVTLNPQFDTKSKELAKALKASLESMPAGEETPEESDIVVILGTDKK